ncbi:MBL fold metallo-hydrolase [Dethiosulfatarculus sandiegensis]|uniref:Metallo-beta-lactamase domain-containing protein n=1 Tax=Dethiosulfatarculus sandiegensis TaxID=1429043 RepID=A0A0D2JYL6_9BACT|nr:ribonuclease Z [Dethiosulfatarculus sandiegensis]KIX14635.1 hypothetical protein X474_07935 [Dethiosulfatarculus sandiegensis]
MELTILGSGSNELRKERSSAAYLLAAGEDLLMLDAGQGSLRRFLETGHDPARLWAIFLSHHHPDHIADLVPLVFSLQYDQHMAARKEPLLLFAHKEMEDFLSALEGVFGQWLKPGPEKLQKRFFKPGDSLETASGLKISSHQMDHLPSSLAWRFESIGKKLVYLGDGPNNPGLADFCQGADLVMAHCAGSDEKPKKGHMFPAMAGELAETAKVKKLLLSHLYRIVDPNLASKGAGKYFSGSIIEAKDLLCLKI